MKENNNKKMINFSPSSSNNNEVATLKNKIKLCRSIRSQILNNNFRTDIFDNTRWTKDDKIKILREFLNEEMEYITKILEKEYEIQTTIC